LGLASSGADVRGAGVGASRGPASPQSQVPSPAIHALEVQNLVVATSARPKAVDGVTLSIAPGEILGIAGVEGNGQTELVEALAGLRPVTSGTIILGDRDITRCTVRERSEAGLAHIPEDRHRRGLILEYPVADNLILGAQRRFTRGRVPAGGGWVLDRGRILENAERKIAQFDIRPPDPGAPARALSGGNQQKVVIAREMGSDFAVLLAAQPTRGVDVGAIEFIHAQIRAARERGKAVLLVSAELPEILALADRVAVMYRGRIVGIMPRREASAETLGPLMTGAAGAEGAGASAA
jgi:simple sugar transport system ATP-binding protein